MLVDRQQQSCDTAAREMRRKVLEGGLFVVAPRTGFFGVPSGGCRPVVIAHGGAQLRPLSSGNLASIFDLL
jgi:hypothetical protein